MASLRTHHRIQQRFGAVVVAVAASATCATAQQEAPAGIIAAQIRAQGFRCEEAVTAKIESRAPNTAVWVLNCKNATYRVRLTPNMAAQVERIE